MSFSTWILVDVTKALFLYVGAIGALIALLLTLITVFIPLFDRSPETELRKRPLVLALGVILFGGFILAWAAGHRASLPGDRISVPEELIEERAVPPLQGSASAGPAGETETVGEEVEE